MQGRRGAQRHSDYRERPQSHHHHHRRRRRWAGGRGEGGRKPVSWTPPPPSLAAVPGPFPSHRQALGDGEEGGRGTPTKITQNDPHEALIIGSRKMMGRKIVFEQLSARAASQPIFHPISSRPGTKAHFSKPPLPPLRVADACARPCTERTRRERAKQSQREKIFNDMPQAPFEEESNTKTPKIDGNTTDRCSDKGADLQRAK